MSSRMEVDSVLVPSEFNTPLPLIHSSLSFISVQSLSSARGSTPLTKHRRRPATCVVFVGVVRLSPCVYLCQNGRRYYDASKSMEYASEASIDRLRCLRGLHHCGVLQVGNRETDAKFRHTVEEFQRSSSRSPLCAIKPRKEFPSLRGRSKTINSLKQRQIEQYFRGENVPRIKNASRKAVTFDLSSSIKEADGLVKRAPVKVLQSSNGESKIGQPHPDKLLLRRPKKASQAFTIEDQFFIGLAETIKLRPLNFKTSNDQYLYYSQNYPLLLDANADEMAIVRRRTPTPEISNTIAAAKRSVNLKARLNMLESSLDTLDKETEDVDFRTVLRDDVFYPTRWPWNEKKPSEDDLLEETPGDNYAGTG